MTTLNAATAWSPPTAFRTSERQGTVYAAAAATIRAFRTLAFRTLAFRTLASTTTFHSTASTGGTGVRL